MALRATVTFVKAQSLATYVNVSAMDYHVRARSFENPFYIDTIVLSEVIGIAYSRPENETLTVSDVQFYDVSKLVPDTINFNDNISTAFATNITSALTLNDFVNRIDSLPEGEIATLIELIGFKHSSIETDSFTYSDLLSHLMSKIETDSVSVSSNASLEPRKNETEILTFGDSDVFLFGKNEDETLNFSDTDSFDYAKSLASGFSLNSLLIVNNEFVEDDTDLFSFSDTISISRVHGRALGNMVLGSSQLN